MPVWTLFVFAHLHVDVYREKGSEKEKSIIEGIGTKRCQRRPETLRLRAPMWLVHEMKGNESGAYLMGYQTS